MIEKWEYKIEVGPYTGAGYGLTRETIVDWLATLGQEGWELTAIGEEGHVWPWYFFKRKLTSSNYVEGTGPL